MPTPIKPCGVNPKQPSEWKRLKDWEKKDIPPYPGIYQICYAPNGDPEYLNLKPDDNRFQPPEHGNCTDLKGVLYIGKAVCFRDRFWNCVSTWKREISPTKITDHGSYKKWIGCSDLQRNYTIEKLLFRFCPISHEVWRPKTNNYASKLREALWPQNGKSADDITSSAAFAEENSLLRKYKRCFGTLPPLNSYGPQTGTPTDEEMKRILEDLGKPDCALNDGDDE